MNFEQMNVAPDIVRALKELGITEPTSIQEKSIPIIKSGKDLVGMSKTGSGKTAAFGIPLLEKVVPGKGLQALIMAPTRELAVQIAGELEKFSKYNRRSVALVFGGVGYGPQIEAMSKADIIVATPGRLLDHLQQKQVNLSTVNFVVLDEADKMVDMGFIEDIEKILSQTSRSKQMLLFGATISNEVERLKQQHMKDPEEARADSYVEDEYLEQYYVNLERFEKFSYLVHTLKREKTDRVIIFCSARTTVEVVCNNLKRQGFNAEMIHGKMMQNKRMKVIEKFHKHHNTVLVASAVAARGLDIKDVSHVINYDVSQDPQEYVHRVGRTARAGEKGKAITLLCDTDHEAFRNVLSRNDVDVKELQKGRFPNLRFDASGFRKKHGSFNRPNFGGRRPSERQGSDRSKGRSRRERGRSARPGSRNDRQGFQPRGGRGARGRSDGFQHDSQDDQPSVGNWRTKMQKPAEAHW